jgi:hypothetical protein
MQVINGLDMQVIKKRTEAERVREYRNRMGNEGRQKDAARKRRNRAETIPEFIGVDSEGIGKGNRHRAVVLSAYDKYGNGDFHIARNVDRGLQWEEVFRFLYSQYETFPKVAFVGFFLGYDFNNWLCHRAGFPEKAARSLLTLEGKAARKLPGMKGRSRYRQVIVGRWEVDTLGFKRLSIRPRPGGCYCYEEAIKCIHKQLPWMHICDSGSFFQMSFLAVIDSKKWEEDPDGWPITQEMYDRILKGKNRRDHAKLDQDMLDYNKDENIALALVMERLAKGFASIGIKVAKDQWYGPGATAAKWLQQIGAPKRSDLRLKGKDGSPALMPKWFWEYCRNTYYGGWFEIFSHGIIQGDTFNYDINNAYPYAATKLPHICRDCGYRRGKGYYNDTGKYVLLHCTVHTHADRIGAVPYRAKDGTILRPRVSSGWYWKHEIDAAIDAQLVEGIVTDEWAEFLPCNHPVPFAREIERFYNLRIEKGKDSAQGMAIKLNNNSIYGKFAQSIGAAPYNNWFYASYITSHCRTQILNAIATHPAKAQAVLMVATDGICFDSPHPRLPVSKCLGEWDHSVYTDLVLFKPGVYWHKHGKENLLKVKSRGVPKEAFMESCHIAEERFRLFCELEEAPEYYDQGMWSNPLMDYDDDALWRMERITTWPFFEIPVNFRMRTLRMALNEDNWEGSAMILDDVTLMQNADPMNKRRRPFWNPLHNRIDTSIHNLPEDEWQTCYYGQEKQPKGHEIGFTFDGDTAWGPVLEAAGALRDAPINYDLPISVDELEWTQIWPVQ